MAEQMHGLGDRGHWAPVVVGRRFIAGLRSTDAPW